MENEAARAEIAEIKETHEKIEKVHRSEVENLRQAKSRLQSEVSELRKAQAIQDDMMKLKRVANGGASSLLRSKDNHQ